LHRPGSMANAALTISLPIGLQTLCVAPIAASRGPDYVNTHRPIAILCGLAALASACGLASRPASATPAAVALDSAVFVERTTPQRGRMLEPAIRLSRGDRVVYVVSWYRMGGTGGFMVTNPLPDTVYFQGSASGDEEVSIDGGRTWGKLAVLRVGSRLATPEDVTHVRWRVNPALAARGSGQIAYSAIVR